MPVSLLRFTPIQIGHLNALVARVFASDDRKFVYDEHFDILADELAMEHHGVLVKPDVDVYDHQGMRYLRIDFHGTRLEVAVKETPERKTLYVDKPEGPDDDGPGGTPVAMAA